LSLNRNNQNKDSVSYKRSLIIGTLLGDAYSRKRILKNGGLRVEYTISHSLKQKDLVYWKASEISRVFNVKINVKDEKYNRAVFYLIGSKRLRVIHEWFHNKRRKIISPKIRFMNHPIGLSMLLCDDGCINKRKKKHKDGSIYYLKPTITIATHCFLKKEVDILLNHLERTWGICGYINPERRNRNGSIKEYQRIWFNSQNSEILWNIVSDWIPNVNSMFNKFAFAFERF